jgi:hypothetical protein
MLSSIGEAPVNTIEDNGVVDAVMARQILNSVSREVQSRGWHFNTEKEYTIAPSYPDGEMVLPKTLLRIDTTSIDRDIDVVQRGQRLYDRRKHTFKFDTALKVDMIILLPFDELPEPARQYITIRSSRIFQERVVGSSELSNFSMKDELRALVALREMEAETADYNILTDNYSVARVLER